MSFRPNPTSFQQLSLFDGYRMLSDKKRHMLEDSRAPIFREEIYAKIDEEPYRQLFEEEGSVSRPNFPINTVISAAILKKMFDMSETALFESINLDIRFSYALNLESLSEDVFSLRTNDRDNALLKDASKLIEKCGSSYADKKAYRVFNCIINEQTILDNGNRRFRNQEDGDFDSNIAQNTTDMDATFRTKAGKNHKGYVANVEESVGENGSIITDYDFQPNNVSDQQMLSDRIERSDVQEHKTVIVVDGAYDNDDIRESAADKNIEIVATDMTGRKVPVEFSAFNMTDDGTAK